jgi:hypothetical protein
MEVNYDMFKDPVCNMMVDEKKAQYKSDYNGKPSTSAQPHAKQHLTRIRRNTQAAAQAQVDTAAVAAATKPYCNFFS